MYPSIITTFCDNIIRIILPTNEGVIIWSPCQLSSKLEHIMIFSLIINIIII